LNADATSYLRSGTGSSRTTPVCKAGHNPNMVSDVDCTNLKGRHPRGGGR
jgi:hypothetical protein